MYDVKQFRTALYLVVFLGITGFCMAGEAPGLWVFAISLMLLNAWLIKRKAFRPLPRIVSSAFTIIAFVIAVAQLHSRNDSPILAVGQFLVFLQIVKLWEQRANRDYAQLLVLSLLLMVSAAISTGKLLFGMLFIVYLLLSLYVCLLFHLKVEADVAKEALSPALARWGEGPIRHDQAHLSRSMRRLTALVAVFALFWAVVVFLFFPRNAGAGMFGQLQWKPKNSMTGFSEQVNFQNVAKIAQNDEVVGTVKIWKANELQSYHEPIFLRGVTHDYYNGGGDGKGESKGEPHYQWTQAPRSGEMKYADMSPIEDGTSSVWVPADHANTNSVEIAKRAEYRQEIELSPTGTAVLFALPGAIAIKPEDFSSVHRLTYQYCQSDQTLRANDYIREQIRYEVDSSGTLGNQLPRSHVRSHIDPAIVEFAHKPELTGGLAQRRDAEVAARVDKTSFYASPLDQEIASRIESYLRRNYKYTLDLTAVDRIKGRDPMVAFLYDFKKGHCEYFAGAMTLLCQSLGMDARLVVGFKCDDYNDFGHFYTIRQSHAHAWVEVRTADGWKTFDPTSGIAESAAPSSTLAQAKRFFDFLEYSWQNSVIAYDVDTRDNLMQSAENRLSQTATRSSQGVSGLRGKIGGLFDALASWIVGPLVGLLSLAILGAVGWFAFERWKLRRRARRIGIVDLPASAQVKLMRQLGFYDDLVQLLERHGISRLPHHTSLEFCDSLAFLPSHEYDTIYRLTRLFYRIRYGQSELDAGQQRRLGNVIDRLSKQMGTSGNAE
jgi:Ca2+/Na+ antiporter